jgi:hypothetical protein
VLSITVDWEGAALSPDGLDALTALRADLGDAPLTHFISAAYFTKPRPAPRAAAWIAGAIHERDEVAVHLHAWRSLALAAGIEPRLSPSYLTGTDQILEPVDDDVGVDVDLDTYSVSDLRALVRTSRRLLTEAKLTVSTSFRAGGYLGTPKVLQAIREEGFTVDSSATDPRQLDGPDDDVLPQRIAAIWPGIEPGSQPWLVHTRGGSLLELPIAAFADHATAEEMAAILASAHRALEGDRARDVFVVLGLHLESAAEHSGRIAAALRAARRSPALARDLQLTTIAAAATLARSQLRGPAAPPGSSAPPTAAAPP